jgi:hypothetical protein
MCGSPRGDKMTKNVVLCCDGTANEFAQNRTNVVKLYFTLGRDRSQQVAYYHPGLGTMEPLGALTRASRVITRVLGMAFGYGLEADIRDAYVFLMNNFEDGDRVFLFGFSRGAYTVRAVASLLHMYGLISKGNESLVPYAIQMLMAIHNIEEQGDHKEQEHDYFKLADDFKKARFRRETANPGSSVYGTPSLQLVGTKTLFDCLTRRIIPTSKLGDMLFRLTNAGPFSEAIYGSQKALQSRVAQRITSNRFGFPACIATSAVGIQKVKAVFRTLRLSGCSKRQSMRV